jgi:hypothetical protein
VTLSNTASAAIGGLKDIAGKVNRLACVLNLQFSVLATALSDEVAVSSNPDCTLNSRPLPPCTDEEGQNWSVGEIGYYYDVNSRPHWPWKDGNHTHYYKVGQNPNNGWCFWIDMEKKGMPTTFGPPPAGMREIKPFVNP